MSITLFIAATAVLLLVIVGISFLLFGREWLNVRREERFFRELDRSREGGNHYLTVTALVVRRF